jgi:hypothetical protein
MEIPAAPNLATLSQGVYRLVPIGCGHCGNTMLINLALLDR